MSGLELPEGMVIQEVVVKNEEILREILYAMLTSAVSVEGTTYGRIFDDLEYMLFEEIDEMTCWCADIDHRLTGVVESVLLQELLYEVWDEVKGSVMEHYPDPALLESMEKKLDELEARLDKVITDEMEVGK